MLKYNNNLPYGLQIVGDGFIIRKTAALNSKEGYDFLKLLISKQIKNPDPAIVPVYKFCNIGFNKGVYKYQYDMMRLGMLSKEEKDIISRASYEWDYKYNLSESKHPLMVSARKDYPKLMSFLEEQTSLGRYWDLHSGNIMLDEDLNYRFIDLEGFIKYPLHDKKNDWIRT